VSGTENIETIKSVYAAFGRGDVAAILDAVSDDVDWGTETSSKGAPWYGARTGKEGVGAFFDAFGKTMEVEDFTPLTFAADENGDVLTVVRFAARSRDTGKLARWTCTTGSASRTGRSRSIAAVRTPRSPSKHSRARRCARPTLAAVTTFVTSDGTKLYYERRGAGRRVYALCGGPAADSRYLTDDLAPLTGEYELVFHDYRGSGRSE